MDLSLLGQLEPAQLRALMPGFLAGFIQDPAASARNRERMAALVADWSDEVCAGVVHDLMTIGEEHRLYRANPAGRALSRTWSRDAVLTPELRGVEHLLKAAEGPAMVVCNHCAYVDTTVTDALLAWNGHVAVADRLVAAAGPRVYEELFRRVAAFCLNTLPVPQSTSFTHTEKLAPRELARRALASLDAATSATSEGLILLIYPEGSRTRTGRMGPFLKAVHRYLQVHPDLVVVPAAITGTGELMPVGEERIHPTRCTLSFAAPIRVGDAPRDALKLAHETIAALLPEEQRPLPDQPALA